MKWRLIDKIEQYEPWRGIAGRKTISFEEYSLLKIFGRKGCFPESLVLECGVELGRWLVAASSDFTQVGVVDAIADFALYEEVGRGDVLRMTLRVLARDEKRVRFDGVAHGGQNAVASGQIELALQPLAESFDPEWLAGLWRELYREEHAQA